MAIKQKNQEQKSKLVELLATEYRWENLLLTVAALFAIALSLMIVNGSITIAESVPIIGRGKNGIIFAWLVLVCAILGIVAAIYPYFYSAWPELKRISWPRRKEYIDAAVRTFIFTILLTLVLLLFDLLIVRTIGKIAG